MKTYQHVLLLLLFTVASCRRDADSGVKCSSCEFPFLTGNQYTTYLAVKGRTYRYNNQCWKYTGTTRKSPAPPPPLPGTNPSYWKPCGTPESCASLNLSVPNWSPGIYYPGQKVKYNNKIFICMYQGSCEPEALGDDIWATVCE